MADSEMMHLYGAARSLPKSADYVKIKSHLMWLFRMRGGKGITGDKGPSFICPHCCHLWECGNYSLRVEPVNLPGPKMKKILQKQARCSGKLNHIELSLLKRHNKNFGNKMVLLCKLCNKETQIPISKPTVGKPELPSTPVCSVSTAVPSTKKRKKDRFAGLKAAAVLSASPLVCGKKSMKPEVVNLTEEKDVNSPSPLRNCMSTPVSTVRKQTNSQFLTPVNSDASKGSTSSQKQRVFRKHEMRSLRNEAKRDVQNRVSEGIAALKKRNSMHKMQGFCKSVKEVTMEDRINSLLQF